MKAILIQFKSRRVLPTLILLLLALTVGCGGRATATGEPVSAVRESEKLGADAWAVRPLLVTTVLGLGIQRVAFLLTTAEQLITVPHAMVSSKYLGEGKPSGETKQAPFYRWPYGVRGAYATQLNFNRPGPWRLDVVVQGPEGSASTQILLDIADETSIPDIGTIPPLSPNKTVHTVKELAELTTDFNPDPELYQMTIGEALVTGQPTVVVFATPAFCTSRTCGPQVDTVSQLKDLYRDKANFIHVELYDNPRDIQGDLDKAVLSDLVHEWGLSSIPHWFNESWTFVLGDDGSIAERFEGFATLTELEQVLLAEVSGD